MTPNLFYTKVTFEKPQIVSFQNGKQILNAILDQTKL